MCCHRHFVLFIYNSSFQPAHCVGQEQSGQLQYQALLCAIQCGEILYIHELHLLTFRLGARGSTAMAGQHTPQPPFHHSSGPPDQCR